MNRRPYVMLVFIVLLIALALWVDFSKVITVGSYSRNVDTRLGLDLRGGLQTLLEADLPADAVINSEDLTTTRQILESRANALGVSEVVMQVAPPRRIIAEFPGVTNPEEVVKSLQQTALLEFVEMGTTPVDKGVTIQTDFGLSGTSTTATAEPSTETPATPTIYHTIMTGADLLTVSVGSDHLGKPGVSFELKPEAAKIFAEYTSNHSGEFLGIVLDKQVISAPQVNEPITEGNGIISGQFTIESANSLAVQLRYGSLPIPVKVVQSRTVGPSLGQESIQKSIFAGIIGLLIVALFMGIYYRLPGIIAVLALLVYAMVSLMLFKLIPIVLTLPGIAGFILSIGMAVDANILIFERLKEELRSGRTLRQAIDLGWARAWPSIRDSNISTLITCLILFWFGNAFGASMVKGFSLTLALGVIVSLFTAILVSRTFLHVVLDNVKFADHPRWFGVQENLR